MRGPLIPDGGEQAAREVALVWLFVLVLGAFAAIVAAVLASVFGGWL